MRTGLSQLIVRKGLVTVDGQQNNILYEDIEIGAGIYKGGVSQPKVLVTLSFLVS